MSEQSETSAIPSSAAAPDESGHVQTRPGLTSWLWAIGGAFALLIAAYFIQLSQRVCGEALASAPGRFSAAWWQCPGEENRFNRPANNSRPPAFTSVIFNADGKTGWMAGGMPGYLAYSLDGGIRWQLKQVPASEQLRDIYFTPDGKSGWAAGEKGVMLSTKDGGQTWQKQSLGNSVFYSVQFNAAGTKGWAVSDTGTMVSTNDGGKSWGTRTFATPSLKVHFNQGGEKGWVTGLLFVARTIDGGLSWQSNYVPGNWFAISFASDSQRGLLVGDAGQITRSIDGGISWSEQKSPISSTLRAVYLTPDGGQGWAAAMDGSILASSDGGINWTPQRGVGNGWALTSLHFNSDARRGWVAGHGGTVLRTTDGGKTWLRSALYTRNAAPWYWLFSALVSLLFLAFLVWRIRRQRTQLVSGRIAFEGIADAPLEHAGQDLLNFSEIADAVAAFLRHERTLPSLTLAVTAAWGQGKSSLMGLMRSRLNSKGGSTVWFNAWHHQKEPVMLAALLGAVVAQGIPPWLSIQGIRFRIRLVWTRFRKRPLLGILPLTIFFAAVIGLPALLLSWALTLLIDGKTPGLGPDLVFFEFFSWIRDVLAPIAGNKAISALCSGEWATFVRELIGPSAHLQDNLPILAAAMLLGSLFLLFTHFCRPFPANPADLLYSAGTKFSLAQAEDQTTLRQRFRDHYRDVTHALQPRTLTIFIDDLDRCESAKAAEMLEAVNYLSDSGLCFIILGIAREIVEAQLGENYGNLALQTAEFDQVRQNERQSTTSLGVQAGAPSTQAQQRLDFARRYLNKLIQIEVKVPSFGAQQMQDLLDMKRAQDAADPDAADAQHKFQAVQQLCDRMERYGARVLAVMRFIVLVAVLSLLTYQGWLWAESQASQRAEEQVRDYQIVADAESDLTSNGRAYVLFAKDRLAKLQAELAVEQKKLGADQAKNIDKATELEELRLKTLRYEAQFKEAERWMEQAEKASDRLKEHQRNHQPLAKDEANAERIEAQARLAKLAAKDRAYTAGIKPERLQDTGNETPAAIARGSASDRNTNASNEAPGIPMAFIVPFSVILCVGVAGFTYGRGRYQIQHGSAYKEAVLQWQSVLLMREKMRAPREAKRFLNLSRYLTLRANPDKYMGMPWWRRQIAYLRKVPTIAQRTSLNETVVVALTTLLMTRPKQVQGEDIERFLHQPVAYWTNVSTLDSVDSEYIAIVKKVYDDVATGEKTEPWTLAQVKQFIKAAGELKQNSPIAMQKTA